MIEVKPPTPLPQKKVIGGVYQVFLAGSIEQGSAEHWQQVVAAELKDLDIYLLNPRRDDWDPSWDQSPNNLLFREQVIWELDGLEQANLILMHFDSNTMSAITLLELGLMTKAPRFKFIVSCPRDFWRYGNVALVCERYDILLVNSLDDLLFEGRDQIEFDQIMGNL